MKNFLPNYSGKKHILSKSAMLFTLLTLLFNNGKAVAQNNINSSSVGDLMGYWIIGGFALLFFGSIVLVLRYASIVMSENGKDLELTFPIFRRMSHNGKTVGIFILILLALGILYALNQ